MMNPVVAPLTNAELDRLGDFLDSLPDGAMNLEEYDGFCSGLACAPELVLPEVWLPMVWGEKGEQEASFASEAEAREIVDLVMRHSDAVNAGLARGAASKDAFHMPLLLEGDDGQPPQCNDWARGFTRAMRVSPAGWSELLHDEQEGGALVPMLMLVHEHDEDPESRSPEITPDQREELMLDLIAGMHRAYSYFAPHRRAAALAARQATTFRREQPKVGRNDPCPCGSGRKLKQCCGRAGAVQH